MKTQLTIGELAKETEVPTKTIRFYESIGLISQSERLENGYRIYPESRIEELKLIKCVRDLGLPIPQIKRLMVGCDDEDCSHSQEYINREISDYVEVLTKKITEMSNLKKQLIALKKNVEICSGEHQSPYCCNVLGQIAEQTKGGEEK